MSWPSFSYRARRHPGRRSSHEGGAEDFLTKPVSREALLNCVERALARNLSQHRQKESVNAMRALVASFTPREAEVFALVVRGRLSKQIAHELGTTVRTIKAHRHAVMEKLGVKSFAQAVSIAERWGCLPSRAAQLQAPAGECSSNPIGPRYNIFLDPYVPTVEPSAGIRQFDFLSLSGWDKKDGISAPGRNRG